MPTEKLNNVDALKKGWDNSKNEVEGANVKKQMWWTGIIKEKPEPYRHQQAPQPSNPSPEPNTNEQLLIQIQPTRLKDPVWAVGGWSNHEDVTPKGAKVQFALDPSGAFHNSEGNTLMNQQGTIVGRSKEGTMAAAVKFEYLMKGQGIVNPKTGVPKLTGNPHRNHEWDPDLPFE